MLNETNLREELKQLEKEEARLARRKETLNQQIKKESELEKQVDAFVQKSGRTPREIALLMVEKYGLRGVMKAEPARKRRRTRVTAEVRDSIKKQVKAGTSMNQISKKEGISYAVVSKIIKGGYDHL